ncbi:hypothetical protein BH09VER1_BH09VER1_32910 [soil metagenome]
MKALSSVILSLAWVLGGLAHGEESSGFDQLMKLEGKALAEQTKAACEKDAVEFSPAQLCLLAERLCRESPGNENLNARALVFAKACQNGDADSLAKLVGLFTTLPVDEPTERSQLMVPLADLWLLVKTAGWAQAPPVIQFPKGKRGLPPAIKILPPDLQKAWLTWRRATDFGLPPWAIKPTFKTIAYQSEYKQFWSLVDELLAGRGKAWSAKLMRYQWAGWCGTGREELIVPQSWALVVAFVAENQIPEAINASFWVQPAYWSYRYDEKYRGLHQFLQNSAFDWQEGVVGKLVNLAQSYPIDSGISSDINVGLLIDYGGEESASLLLQLVRNASPDDKFNLLRVYAQFVTPGSPVRASVRRSNLEPISEQTQIGLLQEISNQVVDNSPFGVSEALAETLASLRRSETKDALFRLVQHPSASIARRAADTLEALGEKVTVPPKLGPVRYQVVVNGQILAGKEIQWHLDTGSCSVTSSSKSDAEGGVSIDRDRFFDLKHALPKVRLFCAQMKDPSDLWFNLDVPAPTESDTPIPVKVETKSFDFLVSSPNSNPMEITICKVLEGGGLDPVGKVKCNPSSSPIHFVALPPGEYHLEISSPEASPWSGNIDTAKESSLTASLKRASKVCFSLALPKGWEDSEYLFVDLFKDGKRVENAYVRPSEGSKMRKFQQLPPGCYVLKVPSSKELHKFDPLSFPSRPAFDATEFPFEITTDSPSEINLGELRPKAL